MNKKDKLIKRLKSKPADFTYDELRTLLYYLGFEESSKGKTSGSRVLFLSQRLNIVIKLHKPHPSNVMKEYQIKQVIVT